MHEFSLAQGILGIVLDAAREHSLSVVGEVRVDVGEASGVNTDALDFAWDYTRATSKMTAGSSLELNMIESAGTCRACGYGGRAGDFAALCPRCGSGGFKLSAGLEFMVTGISGE